MNFDFCSACLDEKPLSDARCHEKPETKANIGLGMYHCPECGAMVLAGWKHPQLCEDCQPSPDPP